MPVTLQQDGWGAVIILWQKADMFSLLLGFQTVRVGTVGTPVGTITLSCAYRINLAFMSTR